jgi:hypothetical protein
MQDPANQRDEIVALRNLNDYIVLMRGMRDSGVTLSVYACVREAAACVARGILAGMAPIPAVRFCCLWPQSLRTLQESI